MKVTQYTNLRFVWLFQGIFESSPLNIIIPTWNNEQR